MTNVHAAPVQELWPGHAKVKNRQKGTRNVVRMIRAKSLHAKYVEMSCFIIANSTAIKNVGDSSFLHVKFKNEKLQMNILQIFEW